MIDNETGWVEADVTINGRKLSFAESMALRVAVSQFRMSLSSETMREGLGAIADGYDAHLQAIERTMLMGPKS